MPVPQSAVIAWAVRNGMTYEQQNRLWRTIRLVDAEALRHMNRSRS